MAAGFNAVPVDVNNVPIAEVYPPGSTGNIVAFQGSTNSTTDAKGNVSSPGNFNLVQVNSIAQVLDNTSTPRASIYGKNAAAGDTPFLLDASGRPMVNLDRIGGIAAQMAGGDAVTAANVLEIVQALYNGTTVDMLRSSAAGDGLTVGVGAYSPYLYNGASEDRQRGNLDNITLFASAAHTTTQTGSDQTNYNHKGIIVVLDMTTVGTGSVTLEIDGKDPVSGKYYALLTGAAVITNVTNVYTIYPGNTVAANVSVSTVLPRTWRVKITANNSNSCTYSVGCMLVL